MGSSIYIYVSDTFPGFFIYIFLMNRDFSGALIFNSLVQEACPDFTLNLMKRA